jgi:hypothetical protein
MNVTMTPNKAESSWIVEGKYFYDPETKSNILHELFDNEDKAMKFASEKSRKCGPGHTEISVIANMDGRVLTIAQYKNGEDQFEKQALEMIIQDCRMFAECHRKSETNSFTLLLSFGVGLFAWVYGTMAVSRLFDDNTTGLMVGFFTMSAALGVASHFYKRQLDDKLAQHAEEAEKWARHITYRVFTTDRVLLGRIFTTMRENPVREPIPKSEFDF